MGITGKQFLLTLGFAALAACGLTVRLWPRAAGPGPRALLGRVALLLTSQLAVLLTFAALANALFGFYTSWSDLFGVASQQYRLTSGAPVPTDADAAQLRRSAAASATEGTLVTATLVGARSGITANLSIYLPPQYSAVHARRYLPAVVVDANAAPDVQQLTTALLHAPNRHPAVIVIVDSADGRNIPCAADAPGGPVGELFWGQDLRTAIASRFRVHLGANAWGALSSGPDADCATDLAIQDAGRYSVAAALGPWPHSAHGNPAWWLRTYPTPPVRLLFAGLGQPPDALLGPVHPPLQVTAAAAMTPYQAVDWLAEALQNGAPA
jgi:hypothetical protein